MGCATSLCLGFVGFFPKQGWVICVGTALLNSPRHSDKKPQLDTFLLQCLRTSKEASKAKPGASLEKNQTQNPPSLSHPILIPPAQP